MKYSELALLPTDRAYLHFEATPVRDGIQVDYELVLPLGEVDCRGTFDHKGKMRPKNHRIVWLDKANNKRIPMGRTNVGTTSDNYPFNSWNRDEIDLPFRDGAHCSWDNEKLGGLQIIYTANGKHYLLRKE